MTAIGKKTVPFKGKVLNLPCGTRELEFEKTLKLFSGAWGKIIHERP
jgi:hypothetical protein